MILVNALRLVVKDGKRILQARYIVDPEVDFAREELEGRHVTDWLDILLMDDTPSVRSYPEDHTFLKEHL